MKNFIANNWFKMIIAIVLLIIAASAAYYFFVFLPKKEAEQNRLELQKIEADKQGQLEKEQKVKAAQEDLAINLDNCLIDADTTYNNQWLDECKDRGLLSPDCIKVLEATGYKEYYEKYPEEKIGVGNNLFDDLIAFGKKKDACSCRLPSTVADRLESYKKANKDECFKKYPQN